MTSFTQPATPADLMAGAIVSIKLAAIVPSPFNPRRDFDKAGIDELALSIKAQGLLENLVVRPGKKANTFELMGGERRFRALQQLKLEEAPCKVLKADDGQALAIQIVENLQRQDLGPLEEAEAFAALQAADPKKWTVQAIAAAVGKTDRFVQQRIAIATGLSAPLKKKFVEGKISIEAARTLAPLPVSVQNEIPQWALERGADDIRRAAFERCIPETAAKFAITLYTGSWIESDKGRRYFGDPAQFLKLQTVAAEKKLAEVKQEWSDATLIDADEAKKLRWADERYGWNGLDSEQRKGDVPTKWTVPKDKCRAVVWIAPNGEIRKALGVCSQAALEKVRQAAASRNSRSSGTRSAGPKPEPKDHKAARLAFNQAVAKAAAKNRDWPVRVALWRYVADAWELDMSQVEIEKAVPASLSKLVGCQHEDDKMVALWRAITQLTVAQVNATIAKLMLGEVPSWDQHQWTEKPGLMVAVAVTLGVTPPAIALPEPPKPKVEAKAAPKAAAKKKAVKKKKGAK